VIIRPFREHDRAGLRVLYLEARVQAFVWLDTSRFREEDFDRDTEGERIWVAVCDGTPAGFVAAWEAENFIHSLYVAPRMAGRGVGTALLTHCLSRIGRPATLKCLTRNILARDFYLRRQWLIVSGGEGTDGAYLLMQYR